MFDLLMWGAICGCCRPYGFVPWLSPCSAGGTSAHAGISSQRPAGLHRNHVILALLRGDFISFQSRAFQRAWGFIDTEGRIGRGVGNCTVFCQSVDPCGQSCISENPQTLCISESHVASSMGRSRDATGGRWQALLLSTSVYPSKKWSG